jgi:hypothetical protein
VQTGVHTTFMQHLSIAYYTHNFGGTSSVLDLLKYCAFAPHISHRCPGRRCVRPHEQREMMLSSLDALRMRRISQQTRGLRIESAAQRDCEALGQIMRVIP